MDGLKPCPLDEARKVLWYCAQFTDNTHWAKQYRKALTDICNELDRRAAPENKALTNADRITSSPKELADFLFDTQNAVASGEFWRSTQDILNWLNQPYARKPEGSTP